MKKEDLLLVFEFLATALKPDVVEEKSTKTIKEIYGDYDFNDYDYKKIRPEPEVASEDKAGYHKSEPIVEKTETLTEKVQDLINSSKPKISETQKMIDEIKEKETSTKVLDTDNKTVKIIKTEAVRVKEIMDMIDGSKVYKKTKPETELEKVLKDYQRNIASQISMLEANIRDSLATPEQRKLFREFVKMENFKANKDLDRIEYFLDNPGVENPYEAKDEGPILDVLDKPKTSVVGDWKVPVSDEILAKSTVPQMIKDIMVKPNIPTSVSVKIEDGQVKFKEEFKHGLGSVKKYGFDGKEIKE